MILCCDELPYDCPLLSRNVLVCGDGEVAGFREETGDHGGKNMSADGRFVLNEDFVQATYTAWKSLLQDPLILDLVEMDSAYRIEDDCDIIIVK